MADDRDLMADDLYDEDEEDTLKDRYLTFRIGGEEYGIEILYVIEVIGIQKITEVPDMPDYVKGVINLRGQVIPVMDVRTRFHMESREVDERTCIVVVSIKDNSVGLVVDAVNEVAEIPEKNVSPPPSVARAASSRYLKGLGKINDEVRILLDVDKLLFEDELNQISGAGG